MHAKKENKKKPREVITRNPRRKIVRKKKKENTSLKQKEKENNGGGEPYTSRCPLQPFFFAFLLQSQSFSHQTLFIPQSQPLGAATPHQKRAHHIGEHHCAQPPHPHRKKEAWYLTFSFLPSPPSDQAQQLISAAATTELVTPSHSNSRVSSSKSEQQQRGFLFCNLGHWFWFGPMTRPFFLKF